MPIGTVQRDLFKLFPNVQVVVPLDPAIVTGRRIETTVSRVIHGVGSQNSMGEPPTAPAIKPTGTLPPRDSNKFTPVYQQMAESLATDPVSPGVAWFHSGRDRQEWLIHGYGQ